MRPNNFFKIIFVFFPDLYLGLSDSLFPSGVPTKPLYALLSPMRAHVILLLYSYYPNNIGRDEQIMQLLIL